MWIGQWRSRTAPKIFWMCFCQRIALWSKVSAPSGPTSRNNSELVANLGNGSTSLISSPYGLSEGILGSSSKRVPSQNRELLPRGHTGELRTAATTRATSAKKRVKISLTRKQRNKILCPISDASRLSTRVTIPHSWESYQPKEEAMWETQVN